MDKETQLCLASSDEAVSPQTVNAIRVAGTQFATTLASMIDDLEEPLKSKFLEVKGQINTMLAGLPETDKVPAAMSLNSVLQSLLMVMSSAQCMMSDLNEKVKAHKSGMEMASASLPVEIEKAITTKIAAGELYDKAALDSKITEATSTAKTAWQAEQKRLSDRVMSLNSESVPVPAADKLAGEDADFDARKAAAKTRAEALKPFKVSDERKVALCWDADQKSFEATVELLKDNAVPAAAPAATAPVAKPNPMAGGNTPKPNSLYSIMV